ncbi:MAG: hypothetical protein Q9163_001602 [Psora crenata]
MQRDFRPEGIELPAPSPQLSRTQSSRSSDRGHDRTPSLPGPSLASPPPFSPEPAYIASSAAAHLVTTEWLNTGQDGSEEVEIDKEATILLSPAALSLINSFLDQLLFSFLASSRSTSILSLRPAISEILKPRLAKEAIEGADDELRGYLAVGEEEELWDVHNGQDLKWGSNLHRVFRRTRLRCMVYTRLGDMEEEDEEAHLEGSSSTPLESSGDRALFPKEDPVGGTVSPAAAIFLTSIIEFIGEQALLIAGDNAINRTRSKNPSPGESARHLVVDQSDVEKIAFNKTLGRLWRSWKKKGRTPSFIASRLSSSDYHWHGKTVSPGPSRVPSVSELGESSYLGDDAGQQPSRDEDSGKDPNSERDIPSNVADLLPAKLPDISTDADIVRGPRPAYRRPRSMIEISWTARRQVSLETLVSQTKINGLHAPRAHGKPGKLHQRSSSLPTVRSTLYSSPADEAFITPAKEMDPPVHDHGEHPETENDARKIADVPSGDAATSTMYDGVLNRHTQPMPIDPSRPSPEVGMTEDPHQAPDGSDADATSQTIKLSDPKPKVMTDDDETEPTSHTGTLPNNDSVQGGERSPLASKKNPTQKLERKNDTADGAHTSLERPHLVLADSNSVNSAAVPGDLAKMSVVDEAHSDKAVVRDSEVPESIPPDNGALAPSSTTNSRDVTRAGGSPYGPMPPIPNRPTKAAGKIADLHKFPAPPQVVADTAPIQQASSSLSIPVVDSPTAANRVSTSSSKDGRPMTAGSSTSAMSPNVRGIIGRGSGDTNRQPIPRTTSFELSRQVAGGSFRSDGSNDKEQDFEQLIRSDATLQYTLTSQNMREMEKRQSPQWSTKSPPVDPARLPAAAQSTYPTPTGPGREKSVPATRSIKSLRGLNGLRGNPTQGSVFPNPSGGSPTITRPYPPPPPKVPEGKSKGAVARDPIRQDGSLRDLADFIRSTGPETDPGAMTGSPSKQTMVRARGESNTLQQERTKLTPKKTGKTSLVVALEKAASSVPTKTHSKLKAREPIASPTNTTADLADFLRTGPPGAPLSQQQRSVSSAQPSGRTRDRITSSISQDSFAPSKMTQSSTSSGAGLLANMNRGVPVRNHSQGLHEGDPTRPVRKQRRVLDPYNIDSDEEDDLYGNPAEPERGGESLGDFLRNYTPPLTPKELHPKQTRQTMQTSQVAHNKQRKGSGVSMRERLTKNITVIPDYRPLPPKTPKKNAWNAPLTSDEKQRQSRPTNSGTITSSSSLPRPHQEATVAPQLPPLNATTTPDAGSPHLISHDGTKPATEVQAMQSTSARHTDRRPKQPLRARDEMGPGRGRGGGSGMADLADFLRETEPPAPSGPVSSLIGTARPTTPAAKKEGGWAGMFGRKKKSII